MARSERRYRRRSPRRAAGDLERDLDGPGARGWGGSARSMMRRAVFKSVLTKFWELAGSDMARYRISVLSDQFHRIRHGVVWQEILFLKGSRGT